MARFIHTPIPQTAFIHRTLSLLPYLDRTQLQYAAFVGTVTQGDLMVEGMASLYIEVAPGNEVFRLVDFAVMATAPGEDCDFVSRFFAPRAGIDEDPVTGSAHTTLIPYWSLALDKRKLTAQQISPRVGHLLCEERGDRVRIGGRAAEYLSGTIEVQDP